ncbi:ABC transporter permease subunit [Paracoccaceae bacterium Fryx2]|nr:ABC transporter permease subunit [Paracoccaceae bacterium Fryx2]
MADQTLLQLFSFGPDGWGAPMLRAAGMTVAVAACGYLLGGVIGIFGAWAKLAGGRVLRGAAETYTTVLRGIPDLLVIFLFYFGAGVALSKIAGLFGHVGFISLPGFVAGFLAIGIVSGAYHTEVIRAAVMAVSKGEIEAATAIGMGRFLIFRRILAPLALRSALPGLGNVWQLVLKEAALVSVTGVVELVRQAQMGARSTRDPFTFFLVAALLYLCITTVSGLLFQAAEARVGRGARRT